MSEKVNNLTVFKKVIIGATIDFPRDNEPGIGAPPLFTCVLDENENKVYLALDKSRSKPGVVRDIDLNKSELGVFISYLKDMHDQLKDD